MKIRQEVAKYKEPKLKAKAQPSKRKKPASKNQPVTRQTGQGKQPASKNQQIFVPFLSGHHWTLVVVEPDIKLITILDSYHDFLECAQHHELLIIALKEHLIMIVVFMCFCTYWDIRMESTTTLVRTKCSGAANVLQASSLRTKITKLPGPHLQTCIQKGPWKMKMQERKRNERRMKKNQMRRRTRMGTNQMRRRKRMGTYQMRNRRIRRMMPYQAMLPKNRKRKLPKTNAKKALDQLPRKGMIHKGDCSLVSPFKKTDTWTQKMGNEELQLQLWNNIIGKEKFKSHIFMSLATSEIVSLTDVWKLSGDDISKSFGKKAFCEDMVISFYIKCLIADEISHGPETEGYRIFLDPKISELLLGGKDVNLVVKRLKQQYKEEQILKARHILLPVNFESHWIVYVVNTSYEQIDILDSMDCSLKKRKSYHAKINSQIRKRMNDALLKFTDNKHMKISDWGMPIISIPR